MDQGKENWKFHLGTADPIEDAPSIGPRTAERFEAVGINTVADFLQADPEAIAKQLDYRRINADLLRRWQQQTTLACRIPQLRGHDAQILVACGITDPEALAKMDAQALWDKVGPLVKSNEGKRIIRNGKAPDFEEVYRWIQWAGHARELRAA
jgi:nucleotidyltransferase/DNA polymerase involved in DNA repair